MSAAPRPPIPQLIPESAPFSPEQRIWLNGFFAGLVSLEGDGHAAVVRRIRGTDADAAWRRPSKRTTTTRPGTTRLCRSTTE